MRGGTKGQLVLLALPLGAVLLATLARYAFLAILGPQLPYLFFFPAVAASAIYCGFNGGLLASFLSLLSSTLLFEPISPLSGPRGIDEIGMLIFLCCATLISVLGEAAVRAQRRLEAQSRELEEKHALISSAVAAMGDALIATNAANRISIFNARAEALSGVPSRGALGAPLDEFLKRVSSAAGETVTIASPGGNQVPVEESRGTIRDPRGNAIGGVHVLRDIRARRSPSAGGSERDERLLAAIESGQVGIWHWHVGTDRITWSDRLHAIHGIRPGEFGGRTEDFDRLIHPEDNERVKAGFESALLRSSVYSQEFRIMRPDGSSRWISASASVRRDAHGKVQELFGASLDITERKLAELAALDEKARWRAAIEGSSDAIVFVDSSQRIRYASPALEALLGSSTAAIEGRAFGELFAGQADSREVLQELAAAAQGSSRTFRQRAAGKEGKHRELECVATNMLGVEHLDAIVVSIRDVTGRL